MPVVQPKQNPLKKKKEKKNKEAEAIWPRAVSHVCCVLSQAMSPWRLTVRKTGGLDISLKEASSSRSVRAPPGKENEQRLCRHIQGRGGAGLHNWWGRGGSWQV